MVQLGKSHIYIANSCIVRYCRKNLLLSKNVATVSIFFCKANDFFDVFEYLQTSKHLKKPIYHNKQSLELFCSIVCREFSVFFSLCYYFGREVMFCISCYSSGVGWHTMSRVRFIMPSKKIHDETMVVKVLL